MSGQGYEYEKSVSDKVARIELEHWDRETEDYRLWLLLETLNELIYKFNRHIEREKKEEG